MKKLITVITLCLIMIFGSVFVACDKRENPTVGEPQTQSQDSEQNEIEDSTPLYSSVKESAAALKDGLTAEQKSTELPTDYVSDVYEITEAGNYYFSGNLEKAITVAKKLGNVHIFLNGVTIENQNGSAISSKSGTYVTITLMGDNFLSSTGTTEKTIAHAINSKENLTINGTGALTVNSTKSGIKCDARLFVLGGNITVSATKHGLNADTVYIDGATLDITNCGKDAIHAESDYDESETAPIFDFGLGFVYIESGNITVSDVLGDGIQADSFVYITGGTFDISTTPTWNNEYVAQENNEKGLYDTSSAHKKVSRDSVRKGSTYAALEESVKGIKVGEIDYYLATDTEQENELSVDSENYVILIEGGTFAINTVDDAIHTNSGSVLIYGGTLTIDTSDDGIHADTNLKIGGSANITVKTSFEGVEAQTVDVSGGTLTVNATDDGINATNSDLTESQQKSVCQINISGGRVDVTVSPNGDTDGIDSNGGIKISGGTVITRGPNNQMSAPIDAANSVSISGGIVIIIGCAPANSYNFGGGLGGIGRFGTVYGGPGGRNQMGGGEGNISVASGIEKTQSSSNGLSKGNHTVTVGSTVISYYNAYSYSGYTTVYATSSATIN